MRIAKKEDLETITAYKNNSKICEELTNMGIVHKVRRDGFPIVSVAHIEHLLGAPSSKETKQRTKPNFNNMI